MPATLKIDSGRTIVTLKIDSGRTIVLGVMETRRRELGLEGTMQKTRRKNVIYSRGLE